MSWFIRVYVWWELVREGLVEVEEMWLELGLKGKIYTSRLTSVHLSLRNWNNRNAGGCSFMEF